MTAIPNGQLPPDVVRDLQTEWIPQLRKIREQRERTIRLMTCLLLMPILFVVVAGVLLVFHLFEFQGSPVNMAVVLVLVLGFPALGFVYCGKMQGCNDSLIEIELFVHLRDRNELIKALSKIECLGKLREILDDAERIFAAVR